MKIVIMSGGRAPSKELLLREAQKADIIIGADRGCETLLKNNIIPDLVLGDFDSVDKEVLHKVEELKLNIVKFNPEKDFTDSELAFQKAIELGGKEICLLGFTGTRLDHTLANLGLLHKALSLDIKCEIIDDNNRMFLIDKPTILKGHKGQVVSFSYFNGIVEGFSIEGAKYPINNYALEGFSGRTVSNEFVYGEIKVDLKDGKVLVIYSKD